MYKLVTELRAHEGDVRSVAALGGSNDEPLFASGGRDRILRLWRASEQGRNFEAVKDVFWHEHLVAVISAFQGNI